MGCCASKPSGAIEAKDGREHPLFGAAGLPDQKHEQTSAGATPNDASFGRRSSVEKSGFACFLSTCARARAGTVHARAARAPLAFSAAPRLPLSAACVRLPRRRALSPAWRRCMFLLVGVLRERQHKAESLLWMHGAQDGPSPPPGIQAYRPRMKSAAVEVEIAGPQGGAVHRDSTAL